MVEIKGDNKSEWIHITLICYLLYLRKYFLSINFVIRRVWRKNIY